MNGEHEARMKAIMEEEAPGVFVTSHEILPEVFEHERFSTTIINACLAPVVSRYLANLTGASATASTKAMSSSSTPVAAS